MNDSAAGNHDSAILVFMRAPRLGKVKTRLTRVLAPSVVLDLYKCFVADTLATITSAGYPPIVCIHPSSALKATASWLGPEVELFPQEGRDLGQRMLNAFRRAFATDRSRVLLVGTDIPDLASGIYHQAFEALAQHSAVIGPALDGGYYLIGFRRDTLLPAVFEQIPWGTDRVFEQTRGILAAKKVPVRVLPSWRDVDEYGDLLALARGPRGGATNTKSYLRRLDRFSNRSKPE